MSGSMGCKVMGVHIEEMEDTFVQRVAPNIGDMDQAQCDEMLAYCDRLHQSEAMIRQMVTTRRDAVLQGTKSKSPKTSA